MARMNWKDLWSRAWVRNTAFWAFLVLLYVVFGIEDWGRDLVGYQAEASFQPSSRYVARLLELPPGHPDFVAQADWVEAIKWAGNRISNLEYKGDASDGNTVVLPRWARPRLRPFCCFRNLVRLGCSMIQTFYRAACCCGSDCFSPAASSLSKTSPRKIQTLTPMMP